jgi:hypothetical protein
MSCRGRRIDAEDLKVEGVTNERIWFEGRKFNTSARSRKAGVSDFAGIALKWHVG